MTIDQAFSKLLKDWNNLPKDLRDKYKSYRSKHIKGAEPIGLGKKIEMLEKAGYRIEALKE